MSCVYIIGCRGYVKVGVADYPENRLRDLQTCCPLELRIEAFEDFGERERAFLVERAIHLELAKQRTRGEWFRRSPVRAEFWLRTYAREHAKLTGEGGAQYWLREPAAQYAQN